jgi:hypothetical protein
VWSFIEPHFFIFCGIIWNKIFLPGETAQKKVEGYLLSIGVSSNEITSIRNIFLGE